MKKKSYQAPRLYSESFALSEHIAGCGAPSTVRLLADRTTCGYALDSSGVTLFNTDVESCGFQIGEEVDYDLIDGMCYHTAVADIGHAYGS